MSHRTRGPIKHTCPLIDNCIGNITQVIGTLSDLQELDVSEEYRVVEAIKLLEEVNDELEVIRTANSTLRDWGAEQEDRADDLETDMNKLLDELETSKYTIRDLETRIGDLEDDLRAAHDALN